MAYLPSAVLVIYGSIDFMATVGRPGMEMRECKKPGKHQDKRYIGQEDVKRLQNFYWMKYKVKLSYKEAEKILMADMTSTWSKRSSEATKEINSQ